MAAYNASWNINMQIQYRLDTAAYDEITDTITSTESLRGDARALLTDTITASQALSVGVALVEALYLDEQIDARVKGAGKTLFISDERYFVAQPKKKPVR